MYAIGISGQCLMGKDTLADRLCIKLNESRGEQFWSRTAFALKVKQVVCQNFGVDLDFIEKWKTNPEPPPGFDLNIRKTLQLIGDDFRKIRGTIWLDLTFQDHAPKIISDGRYINEFRRVKHEGGLNILVGCTDKLNDDPHNSEAMIRPYIKWCFDNFHKSTIVAKLSGVQTRCSIPYMSDFDLFVRNDGTIDD